MAIEVDPVTPALSDVADIIRLREETADLQPSRVLDTEAHFGGAGVPADVALTREKAAFVLNALSSAPSVELHELSLSQDPIVAIMAQRLLTELRLVEAVSLQAIGPIGGTPHGRGAVGELPVGHDYSSEVKNVEEELYPHYDERKFAGALKSKIAYLESVPVAGEAGYDGQFATSDIGLASDYSKAMLLEKLQTMLDQLGLEGAPSLETPTGATLEKVNEWLENQFGDVLESIREDIENGVEKYDANGIVEKIQLAVATTPMLRQLGWTVEKIKRKKTALSVYALDRKIVVPEQRTETPHKLLKLIVHEVFGHALRSAIAENNGDEIGRAGTPTYGIFEESFMIALEQCIERRYDADRGRDHYIAIGMSVSLGLSKEEIGSVMASMARIKKYDSRKTKTVAKPLNELAEIQLRRTFAGMTDIDDGIAHREDLKYLHGLDNSWKILNYMVQNDCLDEGMRWLLSAKFNPFNQQEREHMEKFVATPPKLRTLFEEAA